MAASVALDRAMLRTLLLSALIALSACSKQQAEAKPAAAPAAPAKATPRQPTPAPAAKSTSSDYQVRIVPGAAQAGKPSISVVEVTPGPGYKINKEFPSKLSLQKGEGFESSQPVQKKADAEISEKQLKFNVPFTPAGPGKLNLTGTCDFSVCNDSTCKLIRGEKLAWEVDVTSP